MEGVGFVRGGKCNGNDIAAAAPSQPAAAGSGVVILAPKQSNARAPADAINSNILGIRRVLKQRAAAASGRAISPDSPPAGRRRASPTYGVFKPRSSPSYEPAGKPRGSPSYEPQPRTAAAADAGAAKPAASRSRSRSKSRSRSRSRSRSSSRSKNRRMSRDRKSSKRRSKHSKRSRSRSRSRHRSSRHRRSRSRSRNRDRSSEGRHRRSSKHSSRHSRSRSKSRRRHRSRSRSRGDSTLRFTAYERDRARAEERTHAAPIMRRGKQGLGFGQSGGATAGNSPQQVLGSRQQQQQKQGRESGSRGRGAGNKAGSVSVLDAAAHIPGYASMSAAEKMKARMRLVMAKAEQQGAAADAAADASAGAGTAALRGKAPWRFVFDKHGALDEDKLARQQLMDAEVAAGVAGSSAAMDADVEEAGVAFVMGTGRAAARRAATLRTAEEQHEDAIFGRACGGSSITFGAAGDGERGATASGEPEAAAAAQAAGGDGQLAASLGVADGLLSGQQLSWRERLALKKKQQQ